MRSGHIINELHYVFKRKKPSFNRNLCVGLLKRKQAYISILIQKKCLKSKIYECIFKPL